MSAQLEALIREKNVEDIVLNSHGLAWFEGGHWTGPIKDSGFSQESLLQMSRFIAEKGSATLGLTQPSVDAFVHLLDKYIFRAHVAVSPMVMSGPEITLRRIRPAEFLGLEHFEMSEKFKAQLISIAQKGESLLVAGATGSGKTSLVACLMLRAPTDTRWIILEDSPELQIPNSLSTKLLARTNRFGFRNGANWDLKHLVYESLRMRPDRLVLGECRGPEATAIAWALQTGHKGLMTTIHAGSCAGALERFDCLAKAESTDSTSSYQHLWDWVAHIDVDNNGKRFVTDLLKRA